MNKFVIVLFFACIVSYITAGPIPDEGSAPEAPKIEQPADPPQVNQGNWGQPGGILGFPFNFVSNAVQGGVEGLLKLPSIANDGITNTRGAIISTVSDGTRFLTHLATDVNGKVHYQTITN